MSTTEDPTSTPPRHPLYLDVPMMTSFLAYLEGGVADSVEQVSMSKADSSRQRDGGGGLKAPSVFGLLGLDLSGRISSTDASGSTEEVKIARLHTSASLFNLLYDRLHGESMVKAFDGNEEHLNTLTNGDLVEVDGRYEGNPLEDVLAVFNQIIPYVWPEDSEPAGPRDSKSEKATRRSGNPAKKSQGTHTALGAQLDRTSEDSDEDQQIGVRLIQQMHTEVRGSSVSDVVLKTESDLRIVATVAREFLTDQVSAMLRSSQVTVLGKVTAIADHSESINLTRRTVMGAFDGDQARQMLSDATSGGGLMMNSADPIVTGPTIQVMPLAIYV